MLHRNDAACHENAPRPNAPARAWLRLQGVVALAQPAQRAAFGFFLFLLLSATSPAAETPRPAPLTDVASVRGLTRDEAARNLPVRVRGIVTLVPSDARGDFTVDDGTGIWVARNQPNGPAEAAAPPEVGDIVEIEGLSHEGHFAPTIAAQEVRIVGHAPLPPPKFLTTLSAESGLQDCQRVSIVGVVQAAEVLNRTGRTELKLLISTPAGRFTFLLFATGVVRTDLLVDSEVAVTGVLFAYFNSRREFLGVRVYSNQAQDLRIIRPPDVDAFAVPEVSLGEAMGFSSRGIDVHRRRVRGTVTLSSPGKFFYVQDQKFALRINTRQTDALVPGDVVEATGFFQLEHHRAEMQAAIFRRIGQRTPLEPEEITRSQAFVREPRDVYAPLRDYDDYLVALRGRLVSFDRKQGEPVRLNLESEGVLVSAEFSGPPDADTIAALRPGSQLRVSGVAALTFTESRPVVDWPTPVSMRLLLRGPGDVQVISAASWWTPDRLWTALGATAGVLLIALAWVVLLRRRVDLRSAQLAEEMRARRDSAVEFESTLRERNRLAADLHDTTEQSLTGLAFQLEATEALHDRAPGRSLQHLELARQLLGRSREDLRRSIWNLRASALEKKSLSEALHEVAADRGLGLAVTITVESDGTPRPLPDFVAGNLLLLAQEGITNALKHARPAHIRLFLKFSERTVVLQIHDDGIGFDPAHVDGPLDGHFGLQGMRERIKRVSGRLDIDSVPGKGTVITATVAD